MSPAPSETASVSFAAKLDYRQLYALCNFGKMRLHGNLIRQPSASNRTVNELAPSYPGASHRNDVNSGVIRHRQRRTRVKLQLTRVKACGMCRRNATCRLPL